MLRYLGNRPLGLSCRSGGTPCSGDAELVAATVDRYNVLAARRRPSAGRLAFYAANSVICDAQGMVDFVYIDETGSVGAGANSQPYLTLVAVIVDESMVQPLARGLKGVARDHLGWVPDDFEFHGSEIWQGMKHWRGKSPDDLIAAYEAAIGLLDTYDVNIAHASIDKARLNLRYQGRADGNAYRLALQFLLEKVDPLGQTRKVIVADEAKDQELGAVSMVADMQTWGAGVVPGRQLGTVIDSLHFVRSHASAGVQLADLVAYAIQRARRTERHPNAQAGLNRITEKISEHTRTWRAPWPAN